MAPALRAAASAPSPVASVWSTSRANDGKTVRLEKPNTSPTITTRAIKATSRLRTMRVIDRRRPPTSAGASRTRRARRPPKKRIAAATADSAAAMRNALPAPDRSMATPPAIEPTNPSRNEPRLPSAIAFVAPSRPARSKA